MARSAGRARLGQVMDGPDDGGGVCRTEAPRHGCDEDGGGPSHVPAVRRKLAISTSSGWLHGGDLPVCFRDALASAAMVVRSHCGMGVWSGHPEAVAWTEAWGRTRRLARGPETTMTMPDHPRACFYRLFFTLAAAYNVAFAA